MTKPNYKKGDMIVCIRNVGYKDELTIGKSYEVIDISNYESIYHVEIMRDDYDLGYIEVYCNRFIILTEYVKNQRKEKLNQLKLV